MKLRLIFLLLCSTLALSACGGSFPADAAAPAPETREAALSSPRPPAEAGEPAPPEEPSPPEEPLPPEPTVATLAVCGDAMSHMPITNDAWNGERYDYARDRKSVV